LAGGYYLLLSGQLQKVEELAELAQPWFVPPNYIWPVDHAWFLATDIDFDSTLVGGSSALVEAILDSKELEALQVGPHDFLTSDADHINTK
jgi:hypothetical protein